jgi:glycosyltransferase involved in cell wall biosynthesis
MQVPRLIGDFEKDLSIRQSHNLIENPSVSVIMPTFARAKDGSLARSLDSIIEQTYSDFELLIVDDGSVDGTADIVTRTMKNDDRVVYLRYAQNSGLPAVRVNAGIRRSRANLLAYMFDDDLWYPNALESLVKGIGSSSFVHGQVRIWTRHDTQGSRSFIVGDRQCDMKSLSQRNMIANHAVLHRKELLDDVGYYDPHILMKKRCDWDLWLRTARKYELRKIDCLVGEAFGPSTKDSIGKTVRIDLDLTLRYMKIPRNHLLREPAIDDYSVNGMELMQDLSAKERRRLYSLFLEHYDTVRDLENESRVRQDLIQLKDDSYLETVRRVFSRLRSG